MMLLPEDDAAFVARTSPGVTLVGQPVEARDHRKLVITYKRLAMGVSNVDKMEVLVHLSQLLQIGFCARRDVGLLIGGIPPAVGVGLLNSVADEDFYSGLQQGFKRSNEGPIDDRITDPWRHDNQLALCGQKRFFQKLRVLVT